MKKSDLCVSRQKLLVPIESHSGCFALVPPPTPYSVQLTGAHDKLIRAHEALISLKLFIQQLPMPDLVMRTLERQEAVRSSQIEGIRCNIKDLLMYEATGSDEGLPQDVLVTLNYVKALNHGLKKVRSTGNVKALTSELIKELHWHLMTGTKDFKDIPGEYRNQQNWIGGFKINDARFVPPPPHKIQGCMDDLEEFLQYSPKEEDLMEIPLVLRMAIAHAQFETIHPLTDGNGRVGRLLLPLMLAAEGLAPVYLSGFLKSNQRDYYEILLNVQLREKWSEWVSFIATGIDEAAYEIMITIRNLLAILRQWQSDVDRLGFHPNSAINRLPELLIANPVITIDQVKEALNTSLSDAYTALTKLKEMGILKQSKNQVFMAHEVIRLLDRQG